MDLRKKKQTEDVTVVLIANLIVLGVMNVAVISCSVSDYCEYEFMKVSSGGDKQQCH